ncbi:MAG: ABC transporter ATP-binding protein [Bacillota bacterium]
MMRTFRLVWRMILQKPALYAAHGLAFAAHQLGTLAPGLVVKAVFDSLATAQTPNRGVYSLIALLVGIAAGRAGILIAGGMVDAPRAFYTYMLVVRNLLGGFLGLPRAALLKTSPGETVTLFRDDAGEPEEVVSNIPDLLGAAASLVLATVVLYRVDAALTRLVFIPLCLVVVVAQIAGELIENRRRDTRDATEDLTLMMGEVLGVSQAIQIAGAEETARAHLNVLSETRKKVALREKRVTLGMESIQAGTVSIGGGIVMLLAANSIAGGSLSIGEFSLFISYLTIIGEHSVYLGGWGARLRQLRVSFDRMTELLGGSPAEELVARRPLYSAGAPAGEELYQEGYARPHEPLEILSVRAMTAFYPGTGNGIRDVSFDLQGGTVTAIAGEVGSGKTTLLRAILGLIPLQGGRVLWNGRRIDGLAAFMTYPQCGYVPQTPYLFSESIRENILLGLESRGALVDHAIWRAVLDQDLACLPDGSDTQVGTGGQRLSGGQIQRVAAARALVRSPALLLLDDSASALDVETEQAFWERILEKRGTTCLVVTNRPEVLSRADQVLYMKDGRVVERGKYDGSAKEV